VIKHFAADGTVKREWPEGLHAASFERDGKRFASVAKSNAVEIVELADGEQVGEAFVAAIASELVAADVHPIESALSATPLPPVAIAPAPKPPVVPDAQKIGSALADLAASTALIPVDIHPIEAALAAAIPGSTTEHHVPSPAEVVETAAHALSDAAEVLKQEEARNASNAGALNVEPQGAQATHSTEAEQIPTVEAQHG
jgi:hypothetical protein